MGMLRARRVLIAVFFALVMVVGGAAPALACCCVPHVCEGALDTAECHAVTGQ